MSPSIRSALSIFLVWFIAINAFVLVANNRVTLQDDTAYPWIDPATVAQGHTWNPIPLHAKWDSFWLLSVAFEGYSYEPRQLSNVVFFPLYPVLVKSVSLFTNGEGVLAGWIVSTLALVLSVILLTRLVKEFHPRVNPSMVVLLLLLFPTAFFLNAVYNESLFLFFSVTTFYFLFKKNFWIAGIFALLASLTRITGVLLLLPMAWEYFTTFRGSKALQPKIVSLALAPLGTALFFLYHLVAFGNFLLFFEVQKSWGRAFALNADHFALFGYPSTANFILDMLFVTVALIGSILAFRKLRPSYGIYMIAVILSAVASGTLMSIGRYVLALFPLFILIASIKSETGRWAWLIPSTLLLGLYSLLFSANYWAG